MKICKLVAFAGGMVVGGVMALLLAPKKGSEMRRDIAEHIYGAKRRLDELTECAMHGCESEGIKLKE